MSGAFTTGDVILNLFSGAVALLVSYYAYKYNRLVSNSVLRFIGLGFTALGVGLLVEAMTALSVAFLDHTRATEATLLLASTLAYLVLQFLGYLVIAIGYTVGAFSAGNSGATVLALLVPNSPPLRYYFLRVGDNIVASFIIIVLLAFVVFQGLLIYREHRNRLSLLVLAGFTFILLGQLVTLGSLLILSPAVYFVGDFIRFGGFLAMLMFLVGSGKVEPT